MFSNLLETVFGSESFLHVGVEQPSHEALAFVAHFDAHLRCCFNVPGILAEGRLHGRVAIRARVEGLDAGEKFVCKDTNRPPITLKTSLMLLQLLRCQIIPMLGNTLLISRLTRRILQLRGAKIRQPHIPISAHEDVLRSQVPVDNVVFVQITDADDALDQVEFGQFFVELSMLLELKVHVTATVEGHRSNDFVLGLVAVELLLEEWTRGCAHDLLLQDSLLHEILLLNPVFPHDFQCQVHFRILQVPCQHYRSLRPLADNRLDLEVLERQCVVLFSPSPGRLILPDKVALITPNIRSGLFRQRFGQAHPSLGGSLI